LELYLECNERESLVAGHQAFPLGLTTGVGGTSHLALGIAGLLEFGFTRHHSRRRFLEISVTKQCSVTLLSLVAVLVPLLGLVHIFSDSSFGGLSGSGYLYM